MAWGPIIVPASQPAAAVSRVTAIKAMRFTASSKYLHQGREAAHEATRPESISALTPPGCMIVQAKQGVQHDAFCNDRSGSIGIDLDRKIVSCAAREYRRILDRAERRGIADELAC
jgi:hypothetical protein